MDTNDTTDTVEAAAPEGGGGHRWMSKREAVGRLLEIAARRDLGVDDVIAIQLAVRALCKRIFDSARHYKRRRERDAAVVDPASGTGAFLTPPAEPEVVTAYPPPAPPEEASAE